MKEISEYDKQAADFLNRHSITIAIELSGTKSPPWQSANQSSGRHYSVTLQRQGKRLTFDFWGSIRDREENRAPSAYDVLACLSGDMHCPESLREFCAEYGYSGAHAIQTFKRCNAFAKQLRAFFTEREQSELSEIQ